PSSALPACPQALLLGRGRPLPFADFLTSFTTFLAAALAEDLALDFAFAILAFLRVAIVCLINPGAALPLGDAALFLPQHALRVEIADAAALAAGSGVDHRVDQRRLAGIHRRVDGALELVRRRRIDADAAERLDHFVVARAFDEHRGRRIGAAAAVDVGAAINAVIVEDHHADRQLVAADGFDLHAGETEGAVAFDRKHWLAGLD